SLVEKHADLVRFVSMLNQKWPTAPGERLPATLTEILRAARRTWHGVELERPDWSDDSHSLAVGADLILTRVRLHLILNAYWEPLEFKLPPGAKWRRRLDTARPSPEDIVEWADAPPVESPYRVGARSVVLLFAATG